MEVMPSLPRIRRQRAHVAGVEVTPRSPVSELDARDLIWVHVTAPDAETATHLAERFGWHPLYVE